VQISQSHSAEETPNSFKPFETTFHPVSSGPWIPIMPDSQNGPNLEKRWEGDDEDDNDNSLHASSRWLD